MGIIIDLEKKDLIYRCNYVKIGIVWINLIGPPISLIFLIFGILRMIYVKKIKTFLTNIILLIFASELIQCLSKILQILKYYFPDKRNDKSSTDGDTPRGIICQIQITSAIFSDFFSLLGTLLLSLRCYDVISNKKRFFDTGKNGIISIIIFISASIILSISFLFIDRRVTKDNISYRYDIRDRCSYWCWLEHKPSLACLALYYIILGFNIFFVCKTNNYLKSGYNKIIEENQMTTDKDNDVNTSLNEVNTDNSEKKESNEKVEEKQVIILSNEEKKRIELLKIMRLKCLIYPSVTIFYWIFAATYRIVDDTFMMKYDSGNDPLKRAEEERELFEKYPIFQFIVQFFLVTYTFFSSIRGILYGISFLVFEEKIFFNFFKKCFKRYYKDRDSETNDEEEEKELVRKTNSTSISDVYIRKNKEKEEQKEESNYHDIEMNTSNKYDKDNENK